MTRDWLQAPQRRSIGGAQPVTDSGFCEDVMRALGIGFDLLPKLADIDAQILRVGEIAPQLAQQEFVGKNLAGMLHKHTKQFVFFWRKFDFFIANFDDPPHQIDREVVDAKERPLAMSL